MLERHRVKPTLAAGLIVLGLLALMTAVVVATVRGVTDQTDEIGDSVDAAIGNAVDPLGIDQASLDTPGPPSRKRPRPSPAASSPTCSPASTRWSASPAA